MQIIIGDFAKSIRQSTITIRLAMRNRTIQRLQVGVTLNGQAVVAGTLVAGNCATDVFHRKRWSLERWRHADLILHLGPLGTYAGSISTAAFRQRSDAPGSRVDSISNAATGGLWRYGRFTM